MNRRIGVTRAGPRAAVDKNASPHPPGVPNADFASLGEAAPPIRPMLAKLASALPETGDYLFEPKWDGFRAIVFRTAREVLIQSRDLRPFDRYFPDLHDAFLRLLPRGCVVDGEIVMAARSGLDSTRCSCACTRRRRGLLH